MAVCPAWMHQLAPPSPDRQEPGAHTGAAGIKKNEAWRQTEPWPRAPSH